MIDTPMLTIRYAWSAYERGKISREEMITVLLNYLNARAAENEQQCPFPEVES